MAVHETLAIVLAFTLTSLSTVVVALRFYSRYFLVGKLRSSDWVMLAALAVTWGTPIVNYYQFVYMDYSSARAPEDFKRIMTGSLLTMWIFRLNYIIDHLLIKTSILLFYNYITAAHRAYYWIVRTMLGLVIVGGLVMALVSIFICNPPQIAWDAEVFIKEFGPHPVFPTQCFNPSVLWVFQAAYNLATDGVVWLLPIPFFLYLQTMPVKRRIELVVTFSIGFVAIAASAVRLAVTLRWVSSFKEIGDSWQQLLLWSQVEQHSGIIAACIPFLRPIFRKIVKRVRVRSPSPERRLMRPVTPQQRARPRTPIIPSPAPTFDSDDVFRAPTMPLSPIKMEMPMFRTV